MKIIKLQTVDSTNSEAKRWREKTGETYFAISAQKQTAGRGRFDRSWQTPEGNLAVTIVVPIPHNTSTLPSISLVTGLAICDVLAFFIKNADIKIKWPNDILVNKAKISGTLIEVDSNSIYVGIGINRSVSPEDIPYATATVQQFSGQESSEMVDVLVTRWNDYFEAWQQFGFENLVSSYIARMNRLNELVEISFDPEKTNKISGICRGVDNFGNLLLEDEKGIIEKYNYGEIQNLG
ncbi:biotin--[acetyl-CoA-carboxylase] ligase [Lelliottia amnigena]|uniref:biotin--[acetyl-CoA-carboxylase] ligase n=1 Tax=Lelliottia amnigena TaxID=61646 RepID=UPI001C5CB4B5|nr:biotin--[acetyl-CoA-carboxylase] ligase [Lelliottia amnigena]QXZ21774.1 biotin--[acetyl-CoA-carboxylase] ligase [Lelliottia amnigena]